MEVVGILNDNNVNTITNTTNSNDDAVDCCAKPKHLVVRVGCAHRETCMHRRGERCQQKASYSNRHNDHYQQKQQQQQHRHHQRQQQQCANPNLVVPELRLRRGRDQGLGVPELLTEGVG